MTRDTTAAETSVLDLQRGQSSATPAWAAATQVSLADGVESTIVQLTFPARAAYDLMNAYSCFNNAISPACAGECDTCQSDRFLINVWLAFTPEFQPLVIALSSSLPLFVSLWITTGAHAQTARVHNLVEHPSRAVGQVMQQRRQ